MITKIFNRLNKTETKRFLRVLKNLDNGNKVGWIDGNAIAHYVISSFQKMYYGINGEKQRNTEFAHETREMIRDYIQEKYQLERNFYI